LPSDVAGASKRDRIRSDVVNSRLPDPRLDLIYRLEASVGDPQDVGQISVGHRRIVPLNGGTFSGPEQRGTLLPGVSAHLDQIRMCSMSHVWGVRAAFCCDK
jgi:hypothetical protein